MRNYWLFHKRLREYVETHQLTTKRIPFTDAAAESLWTDVDATFAPEKVHYWITFSGQTIYEVVFIILDPNGGSIADGSDLSVFESNKNNIIWKWAI